MGWWIWDRDGMGWSRILRWGQTDCGGVWMWTDVGKGWTELMTDVEMGWAVLGWATVRRGVRWCTELEVIM